MTSKGLQRLKNSTCKVDSNYIDIPVQQYPRFLKMKIKLINKNF